MINRDKFIPEIIKKEQNNNNIVIEIYKGCLNQVYNLPKSYTYTLIDWDVLKELPEIEFKRLLKHYNLNKEVK